VGDAHRLVGIASWEFCEVVAITQLFFKHYPMNLPSPSSTILPPVGLSWSLLWSICNTRFIQCSCSLSRLSTALPFDTSVANRETIEFVVALGKYTWSAGSYRVHRCSRQRICYDVICPFSVTSKLPIEPAPNDTFVRWDSPSTQWFKATWPLKMKRRPYRYGRNSLTAQTTAVQPPWMLLWSAGR
jgi:hypothetical protein